MNTRNFWLGLILVVIPGLALAGHMERKQSKELTQFQFIQADKGSGKESGEWLPAMVPGDVITDLVKAGKIKHPYYDFNAKKALWVNDKDWVYKTEFSSDAAADERVWILFRGIDYQSQASVNGKEVFKHTGMFSKIFVDITPNLKSGANQLEVKLFGMKNRIHTPSATLNNIIEQLQRRTVTKTQMSYGWDFAPELIGAGIWDKVELFKTGPALIEDLGIKTKNSGEVSLAMSLDSKFAGNAVLKISVAPENFGDKKPVFQKEFPVSLSSGKSSPNAQFLIPNPQLWWTWDLGDQNLYRLRAELVINGKTSDVIEETFGFREVVWEQNPGAQEGWKWVLKLNHKRLFLRGANWVPPESLFGQLDDSRYQKLMGMARDAHINIFRIWGGGNREHDIFYDLADRAGIMLWQEFPFACIYVPGYPTDEKFLNLVTQEVSGIVLATRNHPSVIIYSGGNEFNVDQNKKVVDRMRAAAKALDADRRFIGASPAEGDSHNWIVWHQKGNLVDYYLDEHALMSEFGLQAFPSVKTLEKYISPDKRWPIGQVFVFHNLHQGKMMKYLSATPHSENLASYVEASQRMQAYYYQRSTEHWRMRKYRYSGTLFWQFNEPWPATCWSVIDYELTPKLAYERIKDSYNPLLIAADLAVRGWKAGDDFTTDIYLVNDYDKKFSGLTVKAMINGNPAGTWSAEAAPDSSLKLTTFSAKLPAGAEQKLELFVYQGEKVLSHNLYDLTVYDPVDSGTTMRQLNKIYSKVIYAEKKETKEK